MSKNPGTPMEAPDKMGVEAYCVITGQQKLVGTMMLAHIKNQDNKETQRTQSEWDAIRDAVMNQVAK